MNNVAIPLQISKGRLARAKGSKAAIDAALNLLMTTPCGSCVADPRYGFIFNNLRFEILNENEGVVYNSREKAAYDGLRAALYDKKISGSSNNLNTFAAELKQTIETYETRLKNVSVSMTYIREERKIYIVVKGVIAESGENYQYMTTINVWK